MQTYTPHRWPALDLLRTQHATRAVLTLPQPSGRVRAREGSGRDAQVTSAYAAASSAHGRAPPVPGTAIPAHRLPSDSGVVVGEDAVPLRVTLPENNSVADTLVAGLASAGDDGDDSIRSAVAGAK